jgi:hypothetical protein
MSYDHLADYTVASQKVSRYKDKHNMAERVFEGKAATKTWILSSEETKHFHILKESSQGACKPMVLWGWKRDKVVDGKRFPESRTVYFSADLEVFSGQVDISRAYFFLETRAKINEISILLNQIGNDNISVSNDTYHSDYAKLRMTVGEPTDYDIVAVNRRLKGKPRITIDSPKLVRESQEYNLSKFAPMALCVGSGLSAESGLPLLGSIHNLFEVDNMETGKLVFGTDDNLPRRITDNAQLEFKNFCQFTINAIKSRPSKSHEIIANLYHAGILKQVFTDNMDDILAKVDIPYVRTRQGIFPDRYPVEFDQGTKALLVVGVAVDRRDVIKQARAAGLKIIAVNPVFGVAPHSRNMDYLSKGDIFFRERASEALPKIISASKF